MKLIIISFDDLSFFGTKDLKKKNHRKMLDQVVTEQVRVLNRDQEDSDPFDTQLLAARSRVFGEVSSSSLPPPAVFKRRGSSAQPCTSEKLQTAPTNCKKNVKQ